MVSKKKKIGSFAVDVIYSQLLGLILEISLINLGSLTFDPITQLSYFMMSRPIFKAVFLQFFSIPCITLCKLMHPQFWVCLCYLLHILSLLVLCLLLRNCRH